jgi:integrase
MNVTRRGTAAAYSIRFHDHNRIRRQLRGLADKAATWELARVIDRLVSYRAADDPPPPELQRRADTLPPDVTDKLAKWGVLDVRRLAAAVPLLDLAAAFRAGLLDAGRTKQHADDSHARVVRLLDGCRFARSADVRAEAVTRLLARFRDGTGPRPTTVPGRRGPRAKGCDDVPMSQAAANHHLAAFKMFVRWLLAGEHATDTAALQAVLRAKPVTVTHRPRERRAMTPPELRYLLDAAERGPVRGTLDGPARARLYRLAAGTGLRAGELRRLRRCDLHLPTDGKPPTLTVPAASGKSRRAATVPLRDDLADARTAWLAEAGDDATERVERESSDFLLDRDHAGRADAESRTPPPRRRPTYVPRRPTNTVTMTHQTRPGRRR